MQTVEQCETVGDQEIGSLLQVLILLVAPGACKKVWKQIPSSEASQREGNYSYERGQEIPQDPFPLHWCAKAITAKLHKPRET